MRPLFNQIIWSLCLADKGRDHLWRAASFFYKNGFPTPLSLFPPSLIFCCWHWGRVMMVLGRNESWARWRFKTSCRLCRRCRCWFWYRCHHCWRRCHSCWRRRRCRCCCCCCRRRCRCCWVVVVVVVHNCSHCSHSCSSCTNCQCCLCHCCNFYFALAKC